MLFCNYSNLFSLHLSLDLSLSLHNLFLPTYLLCIALANLPPRASIESNLIKRKYYIINIPEPAGLFQNGIRDWVATEMKGRQIEGTVRRIVYEGLQAIEVVMTGNISSLNPVVEILSSPEWDFVQVGEDMNVLRFMHNKFTIIQSTRGAISGERSNPENDNKSVGGSSNSGQSSCENKSEKSEGKKQTSSWKR